MSQPTVAEVFNSDALFNERFIRIEDRNGHEIQFIYNPAQEILSSDFNGINRGLVIKAGQLGITTYFLARGFRKVITENNVTAVIVAHEEFLTQRLLHKVQVMYDRLPFADDKKPVMHHSSSYEKSFPRRNSVFYVGTAGAKVFGRGEPIHFFLGTEIAFWADPDRILIPTEQRVPLDGEMWLESTPNGEGNRFYHLVQEALGGNSIWTLVTLPWWLESEYKLPIGSKHALIGDMTKIVNFSQEEISLAIKAGWDDFEADERIRWRRRKIAGIKVAFWQEFFESVDSCFLSTTEPFYDTEYLMELSKKSCPAPDHFFNAEIWFQPDKETQPVYVISVDPGQGKATRSVALVWRLDLADFTRIRHEATLAGFYDPITFAPMVEQLGEYYHFARIIPECNGHGMAFCAEVKNYRNLYYRTDVVSGLSGRQIGWMTTGPARLGASGTKMYMLTELQSLLNIIETYDENLIREMMQLRYSGSNIKALSSDDYHDSAAIMAATRGSHTNQQLRGYRGRSGWNW